jgi:branched-chain amino acid aminotransferase
VLPPVKVVTLPDRDLRRGNQIVSTSDWLYWHGGAWHETEHKLLGLRDNSFWMGNAVFDGARAFSGVAPDLDAHCARAVRSAEAMHLRSPVSPADLTDICREGVARFDSNDVLYIRPMFFATGGFLVPDPDTTVTAIAIHRLPFPDPNGFSAAFTSQRRPRPTMAPTEAKASCLYPNVQRALVEAAGRGFENAVILGPDDQVAEFATANIMIVKDGIVRTPVADGTFLAGITRSRVMSLLRCDGVLVEEVRMSRADVMSADEVFSCGNYAKVLPARRIEDREWSIGPVTIRARNLYFDFARSNTRWLKSALMP